MLKSASLTLAILSATATLVGAQASYSPGVHSYRVTREAKSSQEVMGETQNSTMTTIELFTLDLRPGVADTMRFTFTIDSASQKSDPPSEAPALKGRKVSGQVSGRGFVHQFDKDTTAGEDISAGFRNFLPQLPAGGIKTGMTWADTLRTPFTQGGITGTTVSVIVSRIAGDTTIAGEKAWRLDRTGTLTMSGTGNQNGADLILSGAGSAIGSSWIATNGVYLGASSTQELNLSVQVPVASMTIPIKQTTVTRIDRLPSAPR